MEEFEMIGMESKLFFTETKTEIRSYYKDQKRC